MWLLANSVAPRSDLAIGQLLAINHATFLFGQSSTFFLALFSSLFTNYKNSRLWNSLFVLNIISALISVTPLTVKSLKIVGNTNELIFGPLALLFFLTVVTNCIFAVSLLLHYRRNCKGIRLSQTNLILTGFLSATLTIIITNIVLPSLLGIYLLTSIGSLAVIFIILSIATSIVTHKLFDIRLLVVRSLGYILTITTMAIIYTVVVLSAGSAVLPFLLQENYTTNIQSIVYFSAAILVTITFQPIKRRFDKLTNKIFFRDAYNSQTVLDSVSSVIVGNIDPHKVQRGALVALYDAIKPTYAAFLLYDSSGSLCIGDSFGQKWSANDMKALSSSLDKIGKKILKLDELEEKQNITKNILEKEDISMVVPLSTKDEQIGFLILGLRKSGNVYNQQDVGLLNIASNELAVALQNAQRFEEIQAFNITLQEKVNEATRELKKTNRKLIALDEAKDEFISMASHQLRTPLTSIKGYLSMLSEGDLGKLTSAQQKAIKEAFGSSQRMVFLIADFLNVSRIKTGKFVIELKEVDLPQIVSEELSQLKEMAGSREITLVYDQPGVFPNLKLDDNKIRQVMMNMVDNAIYYTPAGGKVTIQLYVDGSDVVFKVTDTGIGVPKREQHKMFTKFFRAGNAKKARPDGTGLGLFMAQKIIVEQGGSVIFESTEGKGSTFGFRFPLSKIKA